MSIFDKAQVQPENTIMQPEQPPMAIVKQISPEPCSCNDHAPKVSWEREARIDMLFRRLNLILTILMIIAILFVIYNNIKKAV